MTIETKRKWLDVLTDTIITEKELFIEFEAMKAEFPEMYNFDFNEYIWRNLVGNDDGSLEPIFD